VGGFIATVLLTAGSATNLLSARATLGSTLRPVSSDSRTVAFGAPASSVTAAATSGGALTAALAVLGGDGRPAGAAASRSATRLALTGHRWMLPYPGPLNSPFGMRWGRLHPGIDIGGPWGAPIVAATDGCISFAGWQTGYGQIVMIADWDGTQTRYAHMSSFVRTSGCVHAGDVIGRIGMTGDATGPHVHFEVRVGGVPIDPIPFLARRGVYI
jgi:murein DD-endopeptidase MepM/ murein hydrolase activator NlpD